MKFIVNRDQLHNAISIVSKAVPSKTTNPSLLCIKFNLTKNLTLLAYNGDNACEVSIDQKFLKIEKEGDFLLDATLILKIVRISESEEILFVKEGNTILVKAGAAEFKLNLQDILDYPEVVFNEVETPFIIDTKELKELIESVNFAAAQNEKRPIIAGSHLYYEGGFFNAEATDGYRLSKNKHKLPCSQDFSVVIPNRSLNELVKILDLYNCEAFVSISENAATFVFSNVKFDVKLTEGQYPETARLIPTQIDFEIILNKNDLLRAIEQVVLLSNKDTDTNYNIIRLTLKNDQTIELFSNNKELGNASTIISPKNELKDKTIVLNFSSKHIIDAIKALDSNEIIIQLVNNVKPFLVKGEREGNSLHLILPVRNI